jgi:hypothetical protein
MKSLKQYLFGIGQHAHDYLPHKAAFSSRVFERKRVGGSSGWGMLLVGKMGNCISRRLTFAKQALWKPLVWGISTVFGVLWILEFIRDEFFPPAIQEQFRLLNLIPHWYWRTWLLVFLGILLVSLLEGSYRAIESSKAHLMAKLDSSRNENAAARQTIAELQTKLDSKAPKILVDLQETRVYQTAPVPVFGFQMQNIGHLPAVNAQIQDIRNENFLARFEIVAQVPNGSPVTRVANIEQGGIISPLFKHDLSQLLKAGRPNDLNIETKQLPFRVTYGSIEGKELFETVYEMTYHYNTRDLQLKFVRYGLCGESR